MKNIFLFVIISLGYSAFAEETSCTVKGMHCEGCVEMVQGKVCDEAKYSICEVKVTDEKKKVGMIRLVTKDQSTKVDEKALGTIVEDSGYKLEKCATKASAKKKSS